MNTIERFLNLRIKQFSRSIRETRCEEWGSELLRVQECERIEAVHDQVDCHK